MSSYHKHYSPEEHNGICVVRRKNESDDDFIKRFRKKYSKSGLARELREKMYFEKPSDKKRRKRVQAQRLRDKEEEKAQAMRDKYLRKKNKLARKEAKRHDRSTRRYDNSKTVEKKSDDRRYRTAV